MAWSGLTKYMRTICLIRSKPVEFPYLGVFVPFERSEGRDEASPQKLTSRALNSFRESDCEVKFYVFQSFLDASGCGIAESEEGMIEVFDPASQEERF